MSISLHNFSQKSRQVDVARSARTSGSARVRPKLNSPVPNLQRSIGNRATRAFLASSGIQAKLAISDAGDEYEREADRVADQVMRMAAASSFPHSRVSSDVVQRKCACDVSGGGRCECKKEPQKLQRRAITPASVPLISGSVGDALRTPGRPLDPGTRSFMETRFSRDLSSVRVHTGTEASASARSVNALAYTVRNHVVFGSNQYQPGTSSGRRVLAHELAHVIQQDATGGISLQRFACTAGTLTDTRCSDAQGSGIPAGVNLEKFDLEKDTLKPVHKKLVTDFKTSWTAAGSKDDVAVHGYASCDGASDMNTQLSCKRAESIKAELIKQGITTTITTNAHGETDEFGPKLEDNRRAIIETVSPPPKPKPEPEPKPTPPPPPATCKAVPGATPATCIDRNGGYCSAESCHPTNPWLKCVCGTSLQICQAIDAFSFASVDGKKLEACIDATVKPPTNMGVKFEANSKGIWFRDTNKCIWGHWKEALDALHDPKAPIPGTVTADWRAAIAVCRSKGIASSDCCKAQVEAEQKAIDICGKYPSSRFGSLPTDIPGSPLCSRAARFVAPKPPFVGDFGNVADRIAHGDKVCCP